MRRLSLITVLSDKVRENQLIVLEDLRIEGPNTKEMVQVLNAIEAGPAPLLVTDEPDASIFRAGKNISGLSMLPASLLNSLDLMRHRKVIMTKGAVRKSEELWGHPLVRRMPMVKATADVGSSDE